MAPALLQVFNRYLERGGEAAAVCQFTEILRDRCRFDEVAFQSSDWTGPVHPPEWKQVAWMFHNPHSARRLRVKQEEFRAEAWIVHNIFPVASPAVYSEALRQKIPIVQFIHNFRPFSVTGYLSNMEALDVQKWGRTYLREICHGSWRGSRVKTAVLAAVLCSMRLRNQIRSVSGWVAISEFMRRQFIAGGMHAEKVFRLYHPHVLANTKADFGERNHYLFLTRLMEEKGVKTVVKSWEILRRRMAEKTPLLVIGGEGPLAKWLTAEAAANPYVRFDGFVTGQEKNALLCGCRAVIQASICAEALSLVIYEAFDYGKPVLAAASGGMPELIGTTNGLLHTPGDAEQLARQVEELENGGIELRSRMGQEGRRWLIANTNVDVWTAQLFEIVQEAIKKQAYAARRMVPTG